MSRLAERSLDSVRTPESQLKLVSAPTATEQKQYLVKGTPAFRNASIALFLSGFATFSLLYCVQPLMPLFAHDFNITPAVSSLSLSVSTGFLAFAIFGAAAVSERFGRRTLMFVSLLGSALCTIASALVPDWHMLLIIRALQGLLLGGVPAVAMTYLAEEIDPRGLGASMGLYIAGNAFGGMAGRVIAGTLAEHFSWRVGLAGDQTEAVSLLSLDVHNQAVSTSSGSGTALSRDGSVTHLFNPANGQARPLYRSVSVVAGNATIADALSTAFSWMSPQEITRVLASDPGLRAWVLPYDGDQLVRMHS